MKTSNLILSLTFCLTSLSVAAQNLEVESKWIPKGDLPADELKIGSSFVYLGQRDFKSTEFINTTTKEVEQSIQLTLNKGSIQNIVYDSALKTKCSLILKSDEAFILQKPKILNFHLLEVVSLTTTNDEVDFSVNLKEVKVSINLEADRSELNQKKLADGSLKCTQGLGLKYIKREPIRIKNVLNQLGENFSLKMD